MNYPVHDLATYWWIKLRVFCLDYLFFVQYFVEIIPLSPDRFDIKTDTARLWQTDVFFISYFHQRSD